MPKAFAFTCVLALATAVTLAVAGGDMPAASKPPVVKKNSHNFAGTAELLAAAKANAPASAHRPVGPQLLMRTDLPVAVIPPIPPYTGSQDLLPGYNVQWWVNASAGTVANPMGTIHLRIQVNTLNWIGFGISEPTSGSMQGTDMMIAQPDPNDPTSLIIGDYYAIAKEMPIQDDCNDWVPVSTARDVDTETTVIEVMRQLNTQDPTQDRVIPSGMVRVAAAYGTKPELSYHSPTQRGGYGIVFYGTTQPMPTGADLMEATFVMPGYVIPAQQTTYACVAFDMPLKNDPTAEYHIVSFDSEVQDHNLATPIVHHMVIHQCTSNIAGYYPMYQKPDQCVSPSGNPLSMCTTVIYAWAIGMGPVALPADAGFRIGANDKGGIQWGMIEMHYNNPAGVAGIVDSSGFKFKYTKKLRKYDAGVITLGDPWTLGITLPAMMTTRYQYKCPGFCTQKYLAETGAVNVFGTFQHMHNAGKQFYTHHIRQGVDLGITSKIEYWDFNYQQITPQDWVLRPGDTILSNCVYDTASSNVLTPGLPIEFGVNSTQEMCLEYLFYYPRAPKFVWCGDGGGRCAYPGSNCIVGVRPNCTVCGNDPLADTYREYRQPFAPAPAGDTEPQVFGTPNDVRLACPTGNCSFAHRFDPNWKMPWFFPGPHTKVLGGLSLSIVMGFTVGSILMGALVWLAIHQNMGDLVGLTGSGGVEMTRRKARESPPIGTR